MGLNPDPTGIDFRGFITAQVVFILSLLKLFLQIFALCVYRGFPGGSDNKESACSAGDTGSIPGSGRSPEKGMATHPNIRAQRTTWTDEPGRLQSMGSQRVRLSD